MTTTSRAAETAKSTSPAAASNPKQSRIPPRYAAISKFLCPAFCTVVCCAPLGIAGIALLGVGSRVAANVRTYNAAVDFWTGYEYATFTGAFASAQRQLVVKLDGELPLAIDTSGDPRQVAGGGDARQTYSETMRLLGTMSSTAPLQPFEYNSTDVYKNMSVWDSVSGRMLASRVIPVAYTAQVDPCGPGDTRYCHSRCTALGGWNPDLFSDICNLRSVLSEICLTVTLGQSGADIELDMEHYGCALRDPRATCTDGYSTFLPADCYVRPLGYRIVPHQDPVSLTFSGIPVAVRNRADPWVLAVTLTFGSFDFGPSNSAAMVKAGAVLTAIGGLFGLLPCVLAVVLECCLVPIARLCCCRRTAASDPEKVVVTSSPSAPPPYTAAAEAREDPTYSHTMPQFSKLDPPSKTYL